MIAQEAQKKEPTLPTPKRAKLDNAADDSRAEELAKPAEVAEYLADLLEEAKELSTKNGMVFLAYLIQVAVEEARIQATAAKEGTF
jgi:hypothetical protein